MEHEHRNTRLNYDFSVGTYFQSRHAMEHEHRNTRLNYDFSVATYFSKKACIYGDPTVRHLTVLHSSNQDAPMAHRIATPRHANPCAFTN
jgi:hypothetical protein